MLAAFCVLGTDLVVGKTQMALVLMELVFWKDKDNKQKQDSVKQRLEEKKRKQVIEQKPLSQALSPRAGQTT